MPQRKQFQVDHLGHITGNQNLATRSTGFEPTRSVGDGSEVIVASARGAAPMKSHTHPQRGPGPPIGPSEFILNAHSGIDRRLGVLERRTKMIPGPSEDVPARPFNDATNQGIVNFHASGCSDGVLLPKTTGSLHIGEQESDDPRRDRITIPTRLIHAASQQSAAR